MSSDRTDPPDTGLRVLIDATALPRERGGVGRFLDELVAALAVQGPAVWIACQPQDQEWFASFVGASRTHVLPQWCSGRLARLAWEQVGLPLLVRKVRPDVVHSPHYTFPYVVSGPSAPARVVTVHDATFFSNPESHLYLKRKFFQWWLRRAARHADLVVAPSQATSDEVGRWVAGASTANMTVVPHGVSRERFHPPADSDLASFRAHYDLGDAPYVAFLGTLEPRKNIPALIRAWIQASSTRSDPPILVLAGGQGWDSEIEGELSRVPSHLRVVRTGFLPEEFLGALLGGAEVVAYPSLGEGFGLPVLEAMACGACVLTTPSLALPEVGGDAVAYADSTRDDDIARALGALLDDPARRRVLRHAAAERAQSFSWGAAAEDYHSAYARAARRQAARAQSGVRGSKGDGSVRMLVVTYSPGPFLQRLIDSAVVAGQPLPTVIIDNGSTDGAPEAASEAENVTLIRSGANVGYGRAVNLGAKAATDDWLLIANPDIEFRPGAIDALLEAAHRWPEAGVLGPAMVTGGGLLYPSARRLPRLSEGIGHASLGWIWPKNPWTSHYRRESEPLVEGPVGWMSGACLLVKRTVFESVGGFDPKYFMYFEDIDLCERIAAAGHEVIFVPTAVVEHHGGHATIRERPAMSRAHHDSAFAYFSSHHRGARWAPVRWAVRAGLELRHRVTLKNERLFHGAQPARTADVLDEVSHTLEQKQAS